MTAILIFFVVHWFASLFFQSFYHHRYASHGMFTMSTFWERTVNILAWLAQGSSYLNPRAYAVMHRRHHDYSDTELDPHSPRRFPHVLAMMLDTFRTYHRILKEGTTDAHRPYPPAPEWKSFERLAGHPVTRVAFVAAYTLFYWHYAPSAGWYLLLPLHVLMGPVHGAIVNWCGHSYGYRNYPELDDDSRNTLPLDFITMGELFQNNHHRSPDCPNFAHRRFEFDPVYPWVRVAAWLRIIHLPHRESASTRLQSRPDSARPH